MTTENVNKKDRLVFDPRIARKLLHAGYSIIDIKPYRTDRNRTVHIFENTPEFQNAYETLLDEFKAKDEAKSHPEVVTLEIVD